MDVCCAVVAVDVVGASGDVSLWHMMLDVGIRWDCIGVCGCLGCGGGDVSVAQRCFYYGDAV